MNKQYDAVRDNEKRPTRFRNVFIGIGGVLTILLMFLLDPDSRLVENLPLGATTVVQLGLILKIILFVGVLHFSRKALFDYIDLSAFFERAYQTPEGAGRALMAIALTMVAVALVALAAGFN